MGLRSDGNPARPPNQASSGPPSEAEDRFAEFMERTGQRVHSYILNLVRRPRDAAGDLTQETFAKAWAGWPTFDSSRDELAWALEIASHVVTDYFRYLAARKRRPPPSQPAEVDSPFVITATLYAVASPTPGPVDDAIAAERELALEAAIKLLPALKRDIIMMKRAGLSYDDIAKRTGLTPGSVGSVLSRTVQELKATLSAHVD